MSHPIPHDQDDIVLKPRPRNAFQLGSSGSTPNSAPPTPPLEPLRTNVNGNSSSTENDTMTPSRTRSFLNLTASTLFGIYQPSEFDRTENPTPWGTGAQTPADTRHGSFDWSRVPANAFQKSADGKVRRRSTAPQLQKRTMRKGLNGYWLPLLGRVVVLFSVGILYGILISHLHDRQQLAPVAVNIDRSRWSYLATWGVIGVLLGEALPRTDVLWAPEESALEEEDMEEEASKRNIRGSRGMDGWLDVVRSMCAFVGIAFAIRKLPWQSTLQLSLTLALANPAVWYLIDRSPPGFILSTVVALGGTAVLLAINPALVPSPNPVETLKGHMQRHGSVLNGTVAAMKSEDLVLGIFSQESVGVVTWIASVLFVSAVCFGNIGRRLAPHQL